MVLTRGRTRCNRGQPCGSGRVGTGTTLPYRVQELSQGEEGFGEARSLRKEVAGGGPARGSQVCWSVMVLCQREKNCFGDPIVMQGMGQGARAIL